MVCNTICKYLHFFLCSFSDAPKVEMKRNLPRDEDVIVPILKRGRSMTKWTK